MPPEADLSAGVAQDVETRAEHVSIAVIGCGPSGMFFCHAMEKEKARQGATYDVTVFERAASPGGIWRSASPLDPEGVDMYEQLWINGSSHLVEQCDYTFDEHFGRPVSVYMKREDLLGYLTARVTKNCPDFFERYVKFRTEVRMIEYDECIGKFAITTKNLETNRVQSRYFDKCVWACGNNSKQNLPRSLVSMFKEGGFKGDVIHSADVADLEQKVKDKRVLLVGSSYSGEDIALQSIKLGAKKIYMSARSSNTSTQYTASWPGDKVEILSYQAPHAVTEDGNCIQFMPTEWTPPYNYRVPDYADGVSTEIRDIDTVVLCSGYRRNYDNFSESFREKLDLTYEEATLPEGWEPKPHPIDELTCGVVKPGRVWHDPMCMIHRNLYRSIFIPNPNLFFLTGQNIDCILYSIDVHAVATAAYITGRVKVPSAKEMKRRNDELFLDMISEPQFRYFYDEGFYAALKKIKGWWTSSMDEETTAIYETMYRTYEEYNLRLLSGLMREIDYDDDIGTYEALNERGLQRIEFGYETGRHRENLTRTEDQKSWKTFRDVDHPEKFFSLFSGSHAIKLPKPWMDL